MSAPQRVPERRTLGYEGLTLGGFRLSREIAAGGMATVYLGHRMQHAGIRQVAAVKVMHPHLARDQDFVDMFLDEARIASYINHPNVCRVLEFGKSEGIYYLAMEYVMGETWADVVARMVSTPEASGAVNPVLAQVLAQACEGLHAAHEARDERGEPLQIVHRDVSPQNIMVGYDGSVRVLDFGIARAAERLHTTRNGAIKGRLAYMAPEQMRGMSVDRRADVWSLGVVLWEGLARDRLFRRDNEAKTVFAVNHEPLPSLATCRYPIPDSLRRATEQALERDCGKRLSSARDLGAVLSRYAASGQTPVGTPEVSFWMQRLFSDEIEAKRSLLRNEIDHDSGRPDASGVTTRGSVPTRAEDRETRPLKPERPASTPVSAIRPISRRSASHDMMRLAQGVALLLAGLFVFYETRSAPVPEPAKASLRSPAGMTATAPVPARTRHKGSDALAPVAREKVEPAPDLAFDLEDVARFEDDLPPPNQAGPDLTFDLQEVARFEDDFATPNQTGLKPDKVGSVSVVTAGAWAHVYLGTRRIGTTPVRLFLKAGVYHLRLRPFGTGPESVHRVVVGDGEQVRLRVPLDGPSENEAAQKPAHVRNPT